MVVLNTSCILVSRMLYARELCATCRASYLNIYIYICIRTVCTQTTRPTFIPSSITQTIYLYTRICADISVFYIQRLRYVCCIYAVHDELTRYIYIHMYICTERVTRWVCIVHYILAFWWGCAKVEYAVHEYRQNRIKAVLAIQTSSVYFGVL